ncbi:KCNF1 [Symbiodinium sp. KB8]|nr:KCNF1 [Symbiodinium sp. KB8]
MVKDASIASHGPYVSIDTRTSGDVSDDWHAFLDQHPALEQVFALGKVTFSKHSSRSSSLTLNATITNTGSTAWSSAVLQAVHGSDMGISSLPLSGVVEPGKDCKVSLRLRLPPEDVIPASMWALSIDDRVFGPLLVLELEQEEDASGTSLLKAKEQKASARIFDAPRRLWSDKALREDAERVGDISEEWATDLAKTGMAQAYRLGSIVVAKSSPKRMASFELLVHLTNTGETFWPEGTSLRLVSGSSLGCEVVPISQQVGPGSSADVSMRLQVPTQEDPEEIMQDSVWALADRERFFGPLLILELSRAS